MGQYQFLNRYDIGDTDNIGDIFDIFSLRPQCSFSVDF